MSYTPRRPIGYLGEAASTDSRKYDFERWWLVMGRNDPRLAALNEGLRRMRLAPVTWERIGSIEGDNWELREGRPGMEHLRAAWIRQGRKPEWWPGAQNEYNFGPNADKSKLLRISENFYNQLTDGNVPLYLPHADGYVRLLHTDPLLGEVRSMLITDGYLAGTDLVSTKDDSAFVRALRRVYEKLRDERGGTLRDARGNDWWPGGDFSINFGPNTNGDEIRMNAEFLNRLLTARLPVNEQSPQPGLRIKAPVMGPMPSVRPGGPRTWQVQPSTAGRPRFAAVPRTSLPTAARLLATIK